ncbi:MAG: hypothetical protein K2K05_00125 [Muribaculaceae bacterium]|nr:hypothetical protein [Muribaculaceae bacterium]
MKKISILGVCTFMSVCAFGQANVVKDAEKAAKDGKSFEEVVTIITPAFSNAETANDPKTYIVPAKAGMAIYDKLFQANALGQLPAGGEKTRSEALMGAYDYYMKALPLDSMPDTKGKIKPKNSGAIIKDIASHFNDFNIVAVDFWNAQDWNKAYEAWDVYCSMPDDPRFVKSIPVVPNDTVIAEVMFNRSLAAFQSNDWDKTLKSFLQAKTKGYNKKALYDYAIAAAYNGGNNEAVDMLCWEAIPLYGKEDSRYISQLINEAINNKKYNEAVEMVDQAIADDPTNSQYYVIRGIIYEQDGINKDSKSEYKKAVELDAKNAQALYNYGRTIYNEAVKANDDAPTDPAEYAKVKSTVVDPLLKEGAKYLEDAWDVDNEYRDPLNVLSQIYYMLGDESNMKYTEQRMK